MSNQCTCGQSQNYGKGVVLLSLFLATAFLYGIICVAVFALTSAVARFFPGFENAGFTVLTAFIMFGVLYTIVLFIAVIRERDISLFRIRYVMMKYLTPTARSICKRIGLDPNKIVWSLVILNNKFVLWDLKKKKISNIMLLLPHCLQLQSCGMKLTSDIKNCKRCGKCIVNNLIELSETYSVYMSLASGGTMARMQIKKLRPDVVLAVACERDLLSGIRDTLPMSVIGVINERPSGPCINTTVNTGSIEELLKELKNQKEKAV